MRNSLYVKVGTSSSKPTEESLPSSVAKLGKTENTVYWLNAVHQAALDGTLTTLVPRWIQSISSDQLKGVSSTSLVQQPSITITVGPVSGGGKINLTIDRRAEGLPREVFAVMQRAGSQVIPQPVSSYCRSCVTYGRCVARAEVAVSVYNGLLTDHAECNGSLWPVVAHILSPVPRFLSTLKTAGTLLTEREMVDFADTVLASSRSASSVVAAVNEHKMDTLRMASVAEKSPLIGATELWSAALTSARNLSSVVSNRLAADGSASSGAIDRRATLMLESSLLETVKNRHFEWLARRLQAVTIDSRVLLDCFRTVPVSIVVDPVTSNATLIPSLGQCRAGLLGQCQDIFSKVCNIGLDDDKSGAQDRSRPLAMEAMSALLLGIQAELAAVADRVKPLYVFLDDMSKLERLSEEWMASGSEVDNVGGSRKIVLETSDYLVALSERLSSFVSTLSGTGDEVVQIDSSDTQRTLVRRLLACSATVTAKLLSVIEREATAGVSSAEDFKMTLSKLSASSATSDAVLTGDSSASLQEFLRAHRSTSDAVKGLEADIQSVVSLQVAYNRAAADAEIGSGGLSVSTRNNLASRISSCLSSWREAKRNFETILAGSSSFWTSFLSTQASAWLVQKSAKVSDQMQLFKSQGSSGLSQKTDNMVQSASAWSGIYASFTALCEQLDEISISVSHSFRASQVVGKLLTEAKALTQANQLMVSFFSDVDHLKKMCLKELAASGQVKLICQKWSKPDAVNSAGAGSSSLVAPSGVNTGWLTTWVQKMERVDASIARVVDDVYEPSDLTKLCILIRVTNFASVAELASQVTGEPLIDCVEFDALHAKLAEIHREAYSTRATRKTVEEIKSSFSCMVAHVRSGPVDGFPVSIDDSESVLTTLRGIGATASSLHSVVQHPSLKDELGSVLASIDAAKKVFTALHNSHQCLVSLRGALSLDVLPQATGPFRSLEGQCKDIFTRVGSVIKIASLPALKGTIESFQSQVEELTSIVSQYLSDLRSKCPRLFFLRNSDLLEMLGFGSNPEVLNQHCRKIFPSVRSLSFSTSPDGAKSVTSAHGVYEEQVSLADPVPLGNANGSKASQSASLTLDVLWNLVEQSLVKSLRNQLALAMKAPELEKCPATRQILSVAQWARFTAIVESEMSKAGSAGSIVERNTKRIKGYADQLVQERSVEKAGSKSTTSLTVEHLLLDCLRQSSILKELQEATDSGEKVKQDPTTWEWFRVLKYHYNATSGDIDVSCGGMKQGYGFNYACLKAPIVRSLQTDKCFFAMSQALVIGQGGCLVGPAGTGKTELVKALGVSLGRDVLVFNCDKLFEYDSLERILAGCVSSGSWVCFDEFNRLSQGDMGSISDALMDIQRAVQLLATGKSASEKITFSSLTCPVNKAASVFLTLNPQASNYSSRSKLTPSILGMFRTVYVVQPDAAAIARATLQVAGVGNDPAVADSVSTSLVSLFDTFAAKLSPAVQYDWSLRALKTSCDAICSEWLNRKDPKTTHENTVSEVVCTALRACMWHKLEEVDKKPVECAITSAFPLPAGKTWELTTSLSQSVLSSVLKESLVTDPSFRTLLGSLNSALEQRFGVCITGPPGSGKTTLWKSLMLYHNAEEGSNAPRVAAEVVSVESLTKASLLGSFSSTTGAWTDGVLTRFVRKFASMKLKPSAEMTNASPSSLPLHRGSSKSLSSKTTQWIVLDGPLDAEWVESMNSVLDDTRCLTLPTGERFALGGLNLKFIFVAPSLSKVSPATVSRLGIVCVPQLDQAQLKNRLNHRLGSVLPKIDVTKSGLVTTLLSRLSREGQDLVSSNSGFPLVCAAAECILHADKATELASLSDANLVIDLLVKSVDVALRCVSGKAIDSSMIPSKLGSAGPGCPSVADIPSLRFKLAILSFLLSRSPAVVLAGSSPALDSVYSQSLVALQIGSGKSFCVSSHSRNSKNSTVQSVMSHFFRTHSFDDDFSEDSTCRVSTQSIDMDSAKRLNAYWISDVDRSDADTSQAALGSEADPFLGLLHQACDAARLHCHPSYVGEKLSSSTEWLSLKSTSLIYSRPDIDSSRQSNSSIPLISLKEEGKAVLAKISALFGLAVSPPNSTQNTDAMTEFAHGTAYNRYESLGAYCKNLPIYKSVELQAFALAEGLALGLRVSSSANTANCLWLDSNVNLMEGDRATASSVKIRTVSLSEVDRQFARFRLDHGLAHSQISIASKIAASVRLGLHSVILGSPGLGKRRCIHIAAESVEAAFSAIHLTTSSLDSSSEAFRSMVADLKRCCMNAMNYKHKAVVLLDFRPIDLSSEALSRLALVHDLVVDGFSSLVFTEADVNSICSQPEWASSNAARSDVFKRVFRTYVSLVLSISVSRRATTATIDIQNRPASSDQMNVLLKWFPGFSSESSLTLSLEPDVSELVSAAVDRAVRTTPKAGELVDSKRLGEVLIEAFKQSHNHPLVTQVFPTTSLVVADAVSRSQQLSAQQLKLSKGCKVMLDVSSAAAKLRTEVEQARHRAEQAGKLASEAMASLEVKISTCGEKRREIETLRTNVKAQAEAASKLSAEASKSLESVMPELDAAKSQVSKVKTEHLAELKSLLNPPDVVHDVVRAVVLLIAKEPSPDTTWNGCRKILSDSSVLRRITSLEIEGVSATARATCSKAIQERPRSFDVAVVSKASQAAAPMCAWILAVVKYLAVYDSIKPLTDSLNKAKSDEQKATASLAATELEVKRLEDEVASLRLKYEAAVSSAAISSVTLETTSGQVKRADSLLDALKDEHKRWAQNLTDTDTTLKSVLSNSANEVFCALRGENTSLKSRSSSHQDGFSPSCADSLWPTFFGPGDTRIVQKPDDVVLDCSACDVSGEYSSRLEFAAVQGRRVVIRGCGNSFGLPSWLLPYLRPYYSAVYVSATRSIRVADGFRLFVTCADPLVPQNAKSGVSDSCVSVHRGSAIMLTDDSSSGGGSGFSRAVRDWVVQSERSDVFGQIKSLKDKETAMRSKVSDLETSLMDLLVQSTGNILDQSTVIDSLMQIKRSSTELEVVLQECAKSEAALAESIKEFDSVSSICDTCTEILTIKCLKDQSHPDAQLVSRIQRLITSQGGWIATAVNHNKASKTPLSLPVVDLYCLHVVSAFMYLVQVSIPDSLRREAIASLSDLVRKASSLQQTMTAIKGMVPLKDNEWLAQIVAPSDEAKRPSNKEDLRHLVQRFVHPDDACCFVALESGDDLSAGSSFREILACARELNCTVTCIQLGAKPVSELEKLPSITRLVLKELTADSLSSSTVSASNSSEWVVLMNPQLMKVRERLLLPGFAKKLCSVGGARRVFVVGELLDSALVGSSSSPMDKWLKLCWIPQPNKPKELIASHLKCVEARESPVMDRSIASNLCLSAYINAAISSQTSIGASATASSGKGGTVLTLLRISPTEFDVWLGLVVSLSSVEQMKRRMGDPTWYKLLVDSSLYAPSCSTKENSALVKQSVTKMFTCKDLIAILATCKTFRETVQKSVEWALAHSDMVAPS